MNKLIKLEGKVMKNLSEMSILELRKLEQKLQAQIDRALVNEACLAEAEKKAEQMELRSRASKGVRADNEILEFIQSLTNILPESSMKQIGELMHSRKIPKGLKKLGELIPQKKLSNAFFIRISVSISSEIEAQSKIVKKLGSQLQVIQSEIVFRERNALCIEKREDDIIAKKPFSLGLRFWVWLRSILNNHVNKLFSSWLVKVENKIDALLEKIVIPAPAVVPPVVVESEVDADNDESYEIIEDDGVSVSVADEGEPVSVAEDSKQKQEESHNSEIPTRSIKALHKMGSFRQRPVELESVSEVNSVVTVAPEEVPPLEEITI